MMIGITMGDANGVGPEILLKAYRDNRLNLDFVVFGDFLVLEACNKHFQYGINLHKCESIKQKKSGCLNIIDAGILAFDDLTIGKLSKKSGYASYHYVKTATEMAINGELDAIVTLPVNKEAVRLSIPNFSGHTELIAEMCNENHYTMMLASKDLIVTHVSTHVSMMDAVKNVTSERIFDVIKLTDNALKNIYSSYVIAVAGLNPHAGEGGAFGREEIEQILPAIKRAQEDGISVVGPVPPDTVFLKAIKKQYQAVVCMYHDQGHIPMKLFNFDSGVNITLGLKIIRTSVDHGTAYDIAWKGIASTESFIEAVEYGQMLAGKNTGV